MGVENITYSLGTELYTYDTSIDYRDENVIIYTYNAYDLSPMAHASVEIREGSDDEYALEHASIIRSELTNDDGMFKFLKLTANYYSFYGSYVDYYNDSYSMPVIGVYTPPVKNLYMLPSYDGNNVWFKITYD